MTNTEPAFSGYEPQYSDINVQDLKAIVAGNWIIETCGQSTSGQNNAIVFAVNYITNNYYLTPKEQKND